MNKEQKKYLVDKLAASIIPLNLTADELVRVSLIFGDVINDVEFLMNQSFDNGVNKGYQLREALEELATDEVLH